jgi:hypothetical protein
MARNINQMAHRATVATGGERYGIEVEAEGMTSDEAATRDWPSRMSRYWSITHDGSLRRGVEFISLPLSRGSVPDAVAALWENTLTPRLVHPSSRTGIHIHCSMLGKTTEHCLRLAQHYALVEPVLFGVFGPEREQNIYCIPWYRGMDEPARVYQWMAEQEFVPERDPRMLSMWDGGEPPTCKYTALNFSPLTRYGTVEFRHAPTFTDPQEMMRWWDVVAAVYATADTEYDVFEVFREEGPVRFAERVFRNVNVVIPPTSVFDDLGVERVADLLGPSTSLVDPTWGRAPTLNSAGIAVPPAPRTAPNPFDDPGLETYAQAMDRYRREIGRRPRGLAPRVLVEEAPVNRTAWYTTTLAPVDPVVEQYLEDFPEFDEDDEEESDDSWRDEPEEDVNG